MAKNNKFDELASAVLNAVGGKDNVISVTHCITRLRFNLKDNSIPKDEEVENIEGVIGVMRTAGQFQVIIGQTVDKAYAALCEVGGFKPDAISDEVEQKEEKLTVKSVFSKFLNVLSGCLTPLIPMLIAGSLFKTIVAICGPDMLNVLSAESDLYVLFTFVGDAAFYFFPIVIGYTASKQFGVNPILGLFLGGILVHPTLTALVNAGEAFTVYGIPCSLQAYSATIFPIILSVWVMSYVEKFFNKVIPAALKMVFAPFLTIVVMLPIALCVLGPLGAFIGQYICEGILSLGDFGGYLYNLSNRFNWWFMGILSYFWYALVINFNINYGCFNKWK